MKLEQIQQQIIDHTTLKQCLIATKGITQGTANMSRVLHTMLSPVFSGRVYPLKVPDNSTYPVCSYGLTGTDTPEVDGYAVGVLSAYTLLVEANTYADVVSLHQKLIAATSAPIGGVFWSIGSVSTDYQPDTGLYSMVVDLDGYTIPSPVADTPAAILTSLGEFSNPSVTDNEVVQTSTIEFTTALVAPEQEQEARLAELDNALLGFSVSGSSTAIERASATPYTGNIPMWLYSYRYTTQIHQP